MPTKAASGKKTAGGKTVAPRPMPKRRKEPVGQTTSDPPVLKTQKRSVKKSAGTGRKAEGEAAKKPLNPERAKHPRTPDPPALKWQRAVATKDGLRMLQHYLEMNPIELEGALRIGRQKPSKNDRAGTSGDQVRRYLKGEAASDVNLASIMFTAVEKGLFDPTRTVEYCGTPGICRAVLPVRKLLLRLAVEGRRSATPLEARRARKVYIKAHDKNLVDRKNERNRFKGWKDSVETRLLELLKELTTMKHYDWIPTDPASQRKVDLDGYLDVAPQQAFFDDVHQMVRQVRGLQLDPMYLLNADLPVEADTEAEKAEISKQLRTFLKRREDLRKVGAFAEVPKQKRFKKAARRLL